MHSFPRFLLTMLGTCLIPSIALANHSIGELFLFLKSQMVNELRQDKNIGGMHQTTGKLYLDNCVSGSDALGIHSRNEADQNLEMFAFEAANVEQMLRGANLPTEAWNDTLSEMEAIGLREVARGKAAELDNERLARAINSYRTAHPELRLRTVDPGSPGCGAGEISVNIVAEPKAGRIQYISIVDYNLCIFKGGDIKQCRGWEDYGGGKGGDQMSGHVKVTVTWPDGTTAERNVIVDHLPMINGDYTERRLMISR